MQADLFWKLDTVSDAELLGGLVRVVGTGRRTLAELLAHLCEVEERRLHLDAGYPSMFAYCTAKLGLSEDEASRRIDVARLARTAPVVFRLIAEGKLSLSVAALLKPHLRSPKLSELIGCVSGKSVQAAREVLASVFPRADVTPSIRALPAPSARSANPSKVNVTQVPLDIAPAPDERSRAAPDSIRDVGATPNLLTVTSCMAHHVDEATHRESNGPPRWPSNTRRSTRTANHSRTMDPLSPGRYRVQFTADATLKQQIELARDLLRHAIPSGDLGSIFQCAVNLLVDELMKRRFGAAARKKGANGAPRPPKAAPNPDADQSQALQHKPEPPREQPSNITRATRRAVAERDGLRCTWCGPDGTRCTARAWLELDHRICRGLGGDSSVNNLRLLCRAHNLRAAEHVYGETHMTNTRRKRQTPAATSTGIQPTHR